MMTDEVKLILNQIMAKSYLNLFYFVEEYIIKDTEQLSMNHEKQSNEQKALENFHAQEIKHQKLFKRCINAFDKKYKKKTKVLDCEKEISAMILMNSRLAVLLTTLHLEIITQEHYVHAVKKNSSIDENIARILKYHWIEEAQHTNIDYLELIKYAQEATENEIKRALEEYEGILKTFNELLAIQAQYDIESLENLCKIKFKANEHINLQNIQHISYTNIFILRGLENLRFNKIMAACFSDEIKKFGNIKAYFKEFVSM